PTKQNESIISQPIVSQPVFPSYDEMQKSFQAMIDKRDTEQKAELAKRDASHKAEIEKLKTEFESKMIQQSKKSRPPVPPKDHEQIHEFYADQGDPRWSNLSREEALQWIDKAFPPPIASKPERLRSSNQNARIDRIESKVDEIGQMTSQFGRMMLDNQSKKPGVLDPNKNQFRMKLHGKSYIIPTFSKAPEVSELEQRTSDMHDGEDLKKNMTYLKSDS
ncbi:3918_t:CDS:2, partial [Gigaspora margarita]